MPTPAYLTLKGTQQGLITAGTFTKESVGNIYQAGHEDQILVQALNHGMFIPQGSGHRVHKPLVITKVLDKSSPLINSALVTGELLTLCRVEWYRTASEGVQEHYFTMEMEDAIIVAIEVNMPHCQDPSKAHFTHLEEVHIAYRKITWTHEVARTEATDDWRSQ